MVDSVGLNAINRQAGVARVAAAKPVSGVTTATTTAARADGGITALSGVARTLAASPPVDTARVAKIKKAIEDGKFPILPSTIADRLLALKLQWNPNEAA